MVTVSHERLLNWEVITILIAELYSCIKVGFIYSNVVRIVQNNIAMFLHILNDHKILSMNISQNFD